MGEDSHQRGDEVRHSKKEDPTLGELQGLSSAHVQEGSPERHLSILYGQARGGQVLACIIVSVSCWLAQTGSIV